MWETSFVAVSVLIGDGVDDALAALGPEGAPRAEAVARRLRDPRKVARAQALADALKDVAEAVDEVTLR